MDSRRLPANLIEISCRVNLINLHLSPVERFLIFSLVMFRILVHLFSLELRQVQNLSARKSLICFR